MYNIIFLSHQEPLAENNWLQLKKRFPRAMRVDGVSPIVAAHKAAARKCRTRYFWVVDADNEICSGFDFSFQWPKDDNVRDRVAVWRAYNPIIGLSYGYGGIKLLPRLSVLAVPDNVVDFTTSISEHFHVMEEVASVTNIDTSPFDAWRAGFREAAKLASHTIARGNNKENEERLSAWCAAKLGRYGNYCALGARSGRNHALDGEDLSKINDWNWLRSRFDEESKPSI